MSSRSPKKIFAQPAVQGKFFNEYIWLPFRIDVNNIPHSNDLFQAENIF
jgi:hypothetical protein